MAELQTRSFGYAAARELARQELGHFRGDVVSPHVPMAPHLRQGGIDPVPGPVSPLVDAASALNPLRRQSTSTPIAISDRVALDLHCIPLSISGLAEDLGLGTSILRPTEELPIARRELVFADVRVVEGVSINSKRR